MMNVHSETSATIFVDADNTLWDTDGVFAIAQLNLLERIERAIGKVSGQSDRLAFVRMVDQGIAERHQSGLRYPPRLLIDGLTAALRGEDLTRASRLALTGSLKVRLSEEQSGNIEQAYFSDLGQPPALRPGVEIGLRALEEAGCTVLIVSESAREKVGRTAERLGLKGHFTRIIEGAKRPELYARVLRLTNAPNPAFMVGDQLDRDIVPAKAAGLITIYFPGGFQPRWSLAVEKINPDHIIASFAEVPDIVLAQRTAVAVS